MNAPSVNASTLALIKWQEGLRLQAYLCPAGILTIGYGHTGNVQPGQMISVNEADALLKRDLRIFEEAVTRLVRVPLRENQYGALVSFSFNVGWQAFARSTLLALLNRGWYAQVPVQLLRWSKAGGRILPGLAARRAAEVDLWNEKEKA
jgi:lysozyme